MKFASKPSLTKYISIIEYLCGFSVVQECLKKIVSSCFSWINCTFSWIKLIILGSSWSLSSVKLVLLVVSHKWYTALGLRLAEEHTAAANTLQLLCSFLSSHNHFLAMNKRNFILFIYSTQQLKTCKLSVRSLLVKFVLILLCD